MAPQDAVLPLPAQGLTQYSSAPIPFRSANYGLMREHQADCRPAAWLLPSPWELNRRAPIGDFIFAIGIVNNEIGHAVRKVAQY